MPRSFYNAVPIIVVIAGIMIAISLSQKPDRPRTETVMPGELKKPEIKISKTRRTLEVYDGGRLVKTFSMVLGFSPDGDKEIEGDGKTPEGEFYVATKNPQSRFHLSLGLSYPSKDDAVRGFKKALITKAEHDAILAALREGKMPPQKTALGGEIYIHGGGIDKDWTWGCVALRDEEIEQLFASIPLGTKVTILP
jgi:murein L,D-transpeptidase YafK